MSGPLIKVENLTRTFDMSKPWLNRVIEKEPKQYLRAVDSVSFEIQKGETFALVGESGSGKSTVAKMLVGLLQPTEGSILFDGQPMRMDTSDVMQELRKRFQMIFQSPYASLNPRWRIGAIIAEPMSVLAIENDKTKLQKRVDELLTLVGLSPADAQKFPHEFSGGQRQRIAIARALSTNPEFIVCDEPTSALDVSVQAQILNLMRDLQDEFELTYLFISHDLSVVRHMAKRIGVLYLGGLVETADGKALFQNPRHPYTRMLLDAVPDLTMTARQRAQVDGEIPNPIDPPAGCSFHPRCRFQNDLCRTKVPELEASLTGSVACHAVQEGRI